MSRWRAQASKRLREGEQITEEIPFGDNAVVVTTQRLLAFVPDSEGANFHAIERPNVEEITRDSRGDAEWLGYVARGALAGIAGVGIGITVDFKSLVSFGSIDSETVGRTGMGGLLEILASISQALDMLNDILLVLGLLAFSVCLGAFGLYLESRMHGVWITIAGEGEIHVPAPKDADAAFTRLEQALETDPVIEDDLDVDPDEDSLEPDPEPE